MTSLAHSLVKTIPEFPGFAVTLPKGLSPEPLLYRKALEDLCDRNSFIGINPHIFFDEQGFISMVSKPVISSLRSKMHQDEPFSLQYFDLDHVRLGLCASAHLVRQHTQGDIPEPLMTNEGIRELLWLRMMRQLASDCLKHGGGSLTGIGAASEFLGLPSAQGAELMRRARNMDLIEVTKRSGLQTIAPTARLINLLNIPELTRLFQTQRQLTPLSPINVPSPPPQPNDLHTPSLNPLEHLTLPPHRLAIQACTSQGNSKEPKPEASSPRKDTNTNALQFADLFDAITTLFKESPGEWIAPVRVWNLVRMRGANPRSPRRVRQICDELSSSGLLRKSKEDTFQLKE